MKRLVDTSVLISYTVSGSNKEPISNIAKGIVAPSLSFSMSTGCSDSLFQVPGAQSEERQPPASPDSRQLKGEEEEETKKRKQKSET